MSASGDGEKVKPPFCFPDIEWKQGSSSGHPCAIVCGQYNDKDMYTARLYHGGELLIGTVLEHGICIYAKDGQMFETDDYLLMTVPVGDPLTWMKIGDVNPEDDKAVVAGRLHDEQDLRIGRIVNDNNTVVGWVDESNNLHVFDGKEEEKITPEFEVLIHRLAKFLCICPPFRGRPPPEEGEEN